MTSGETNLDVLLRAMRPALLATPFVFITVDPEEASALWPEALALIREAEYHADHIFSSHPDHPYPLP